ncbi:amino acid ABC transporter permease [Sinirhodobacter populi]|uniref:Amino acid ABC transporter permease n=1 Tax=Paenirhodobacter populi TaxID=2306993 RepID=A0A443K2K4_9RHOB|nr:amino acid ABC transporter permease [Sinirhodobacter populi]RWR26962.1 amino acid ABC transporter permease [Sinirhodobacter populi]
MMEILDFWHRSLPQLLQGFGLSLQVTGLSLLLGIPLGLLLALALQAGRAALRWPALLIVEIGRGASILVLLQFVYFGLPTTGLTLTSFASVVVAFTWCTAAYTSEIIRAGLESVAHGQREAGEVLGLGPVEILRFVILPQGLPVCVPALLGFSILMLQASSLAFVVALPELMSKAQLIGSNTFRYMPLFTLTALLYAAVCIPATILVGRLERRLSRHI